MGLYQVTASLVVEAENAEQAERWAGEQLRSLEPDVEVIGVGSAVGVRRVAPDEKGDSDAGQ